MLNRPNSSPSIRLETAFDANRKKKMDTIQSVGEKFPEFIPSSLFDQVDSDTTWSHFDPSRRFWEYLILFVSVITPIEMSYVLVFDAHISVSSYSIFFVFDILQLIDNFAIIKTPFIHKGIMISDKWEIIQNYGLCSFILHVIATIPLGWIGIIKGNPVLYGILSINRLLRLHQAWRSYRMINDSNLYTGSISRLFPHLILFFFMVHCFACGFYITGRITGINESWISEFVIQGYTRFQLYITSIYFVLTTVFTIGFGDLHPVSTVERILGTFMMISGVIFESSIIANMVATIDDPQSNIFLAQYMSALQYMKLKGIPSVYRAHIKHYMEYTWQKNHGAPSWKKLLKPLPKSIQNGIKLEFCERTFSSMPLFKGVGQKYLLMIMDSMEAFTYLPGDTICIQEEEISDLLIFNRGIIQIILNDVALASISVDRGYVDGERQIMFGKIQDKTIKAITFVDGWRLKRSFFKDLLSTKNELRRIILSNARLRFPKDFVNSPEWDDSMILEGSSDTSIEDISNLEDNSDSSVVLYVEQTSDESSDSKFGEAGI